MGSSSTRSSSTRSSKEFVTVTLASGHNQTLWLRTGLGARSHFHDNRATGQVFGRSLPDLVLCLLLSDKKFSLATTYNIGIQIITRLEQIHRKGFVHRDIKANNFMVGRGDKNKTVYIIDFGLAKRYFDPKTSKHISIKGGKSLVGTARYASIASH